MPEPRLLGDSLIRTRARWPIRGDQSGFVNGIHGLRIVSIARCMPSGFVAAWNKNPDRHLRPSQDAEGDVPNSTSAERNPQDCRQAICVDINIHARTSENAATFSVNDQKQQSCGGDEQTCSPTNRATWKSDHKQAVRSAQRSASGAPDTRSTINNRAQSGGLNAVVGP